MGLVSCKEECLDACESTFGLWYRERRLAMTRDESNMYIYERRDISYCASPLALAVNATSLEGSTIFVSKPIYYR